MEPLVNFSEKQIERNILDFLKINGIFCWKHENVGIFDKKLGKYRVSKSIHKFPGIADIIGILPCGTLLALEVKTPKRRRMTTIHQTLFIDNINKRNGVAAVVTSIDEVINVLKEHTTKCKDENKRIKGKTQKQSCSFC